MELPLGSGLPTISVETHLVWSQLHPHKQRPQALCPSAPYLNLFSFLLQASQLVEQSRKPWSPFASLSPRSASVQSRSPESWPLLKIKHIQQD